MLTSLTDANAWNEKCIIWCDARYSRSTDFKTKVKPSIIVAEDEPSYSSVVQIIGRGLRKLEDQVETSMFVPAQDAIATTVPEQVTDLLKARQRDYMPEVEVRAALCYPLHLHKIDQNAKIEDLVSVFSSINDYVETLNPGSQKYRVS